MMGHMTNDHLPPSAAALDAIMAAPSTVASAIRRAVDSAQLSRYRRGQRAPDAETAAMLERLSHGAVPASGWAHPAAVDDRVGR